MRFRTCQLAPLCGTTCAPAPKPVGLPATPLRADCVRLCFCASFAINQHGDAGVLARAAMGADLNSLEGVIRHTKRTILYFHPLDDPAPIKRVWCLYEILTAATTEGNELTLGFSSSGKKEMYKIAAAFAQHSGTSAAAAKDEDCQDIWRA